MKQQVVRRMPDGTCSVVEENSDTPLMFVDVAAHAPPVASPAAPVASALAPEDLLVATVAALTPEQLHICSIMRLSPIDFARQWLDDEAARGAAL